MTIAQKIATMNREQDINRKAQDFCQVAKWILIGSGNSRSTFAVAQNERASERVLEAVKAAVLPGTTSDVPLAYQELSDGFLASLRNFGVFDAMLPFAKDIPLNTQVVLVSTGATGATIGEGQSQVISKLALSASALNPRKAVAIVAASLELLRTGGAKAARLFQSELSRAVAVETDSKFLSVITTSISPTSSTGSNWAAMATDFAQLFASLTLGSDSKVFIAMNPSDLKHMSVQITSTGERAFPTVNYNGGTYAGAEVVPSDAVSGQIIAFDAPQLAAGSTGIELDASNQASVQMDSAPDSPPSASTNVTSLWQMNLTGLRATRYFGCERLRSAAVAVINNVNYGSANSPA